MSLTDEQLLKLWAPEPSRPVMGRNKILEFARAIESSATAPLLERIAELERELEALRKDAGWRPIETAPKDGTTILVWFKPHGAMSVYWSDRDGCSSSEFAIWMVDDHKHGPWPVRGYMTPDATHWMPLPPPPDAAKEQG